MNMKDYGSQPAATEIPPPTDPKLDEILASLSDRYQHLQLLTSRLREINGKISGHEPEPDLAPLNNGNGPKEGSFREWAAIWLTGTRHELAALDYQISRLERAL